MIIPGNHSYIYRVVIFVSLDEFLAFYWIAPARQYERVHVNM